MNLFLQEEEVDSNMEDAHKWQTLGTCADYYGFDWNSMEDYVSGSLRDCYAILHCYRCMKKQMKTMMNMHKWEK